jgi:hypothetical protein
MARWYYLHSGAQRGPVELQMMQSLVSSGQIQPDTMVWEEGTPQWIVAQQSAQLFPGMAPAGAGALPAPVSDDPGPFVKFGNLLTRAGSGQYVATVVASPNAFYMLKLRRNNAAAGAAGGLVGMMIASALQSDDDSRTCSAGELPPTIRGELDPKGKNLERDVIILPRTAVSMIQTSWLSGFKVTCGPDKFTISPRTFKAKATKQFLTDNGWKINEPMEPTSAPIHGSNFNRPAGVPVKKKMGMLARVGLILLAIVILIIVALVAANQR